MTSELTALATAALLQMGQIVLYSVLANRQVPRDYALGPRDTKRDLTGMAGRAQRAMNNHFEGLILFTIAVVVLHLADRGSGVTGILAWTYVAARLLYIPAYLFALSPWRSALWALGWVATALMLVIALF